MLTILQGDWIEQLLTLTDQSVQCCVTSPPYWGLRDYGTAKWEGGSAECDHKVGRFQRGGLSSKQASNNGSGGDEARGFCPKCGAIRIDNQLGLEKTPQEYVEKLVAGFREVRRVLKDDGTLWLNLGDSYAARLRQSGPEHAGALTRTSGALTKITRALPTTLKEKDLVGIPWAVAFALRADGWYLRSDIIWAKPNPMPESVTDRPTKAHEYLFLMSKKAKYFYDAEAIKEASSPDTHSRTRKSRSHDGQKTYPDAIRNGIRAPGVNPKADHNGRNGSKQNASFCAAVVDLVTHRNKRSVWTVTTSPYAEAHFATFPPDLIKPCILAGSRTGDTVLDPFFGSGTTGMVAIELGRKAIGIELNPKYIDMANRRCDVTPGLPFQKTPVDKSARVT